MTDPITKPRLLTATGLRSLAAERPRLAPTRGLALALLLLAPLWLLTATAWGTLVVAAAPSNSSHRQWPIDPWKNRIS